MVCCSTHSDSLLHGMEQSKTVLGNVSTLFKLAEREKWGWKTLSQLKYLWLVLIWIFGKHKSKEDVEQEKEQNKSYRRNNFWC